MLAIAATACSPEYNWRQAGSYDVGAEVLLPGKPAQMSRPIDLDGLAVEMSMRGARVGEQAFTLAWVDLPDDTAASRERALTAMTTGMLRNIGAEEGNRSERQVPLLDAGGMRKGSIAALAVDARGEQPAAGTRMQAIFVARGERAWQLVVIGNPLDGEAVQTFLDSFALYER